MSVVNPHLSPGTAVHGPYPAAQVAAAKSAVAKHLTVQALPPGSPPDLRSSVHSLWLEHLTCLPLTAHPELGDFVVVVASHEGGRVFAVHSPSDTVWPASAGAAPTDTTWILALATTLADR